MDNFFLTSQQIYILTVKTNISDLDKKKELLFISDGSLSMDMPSTLQEVVDLREMAYGKWLHLHLLAQFTVFVYFVLCILW